MFFENGGAGSKNWVNATSVLVNPVGRNEMPSIESNKNFYLSSTSGLYKMDTFTKTPFQAGVPPGLDGAAVLAGAGSGFLGSNTQCAYQVLFGYIDANGNLNRGNPSERILIVNSGGGSDNVTLTFTIPYALSTSYFYQVYRTPQTTYSATPSLNVPPGAELQLAAQFNLTAGQISALSVTLTDVTPDALLGASLYTDPSQEGALQTNDRPPLARDITLFSQMVFYANTISFPILNFSMISVGAPNGVQLNDTITINGVVFTAKAAQNNASQQFLFVTSGTIAQNIDATARNLVNCINTNAGTALVYAFYLSGFNQLPGLISLQSIAPGSANFVVTSSRGGAYSPVIPPSGSSFISSNSVTPNGLYISKVGQPEAVPLVNIFFIGGGDQNILRVLPLRDRVIVIKTDGIFVVTGSTPQNLSVTLLDSTIICNAPESARVLNNSVYCMTTQGVVSITESGVTIQSRQIESTLLSLTGPSFVNFAACCHAVSYESERLYLLGMPTATSDTYGTQCFCYNWVTNCWTRWAVDMAAGLVDPTDNKLYLSRPLTDQSGVFGERKNFNFSDYMDDQTNTFTVTNVTPTATGAVITTSLSPLASYLGYYAEQIVSGTTYVALVTAVNPGIQQVTVDLQNSSTPGVQIPWQTVSGTFRFEKPIPVKLQYTPITGNFPHYMKIWGRINYWFNSGNFVQITLGYISDVTTSLTSTLTRATGFGAYNTGVYGTPLPQPVQTLIPSSYAISRYLMPVLQLSFPRASLSCLGVTVSYEIEGDVSG